MKKTIQKIKKTLTWPIMEKIHDGTDLEITSDPWQQTHTIAIPRAGADWREIEYLHELAHATLAEKKHHLLSTSYFERGIPMRKIQSLVNPCRVASDWFADALLMEWFPEQEKAEIREHAQYAVQYTGHDQTMIYGGGLCLAQAVKYLGDKIHTVPRRYRKVAEILLSIDPANPTVEKKASLINRLAALTCPYRVVVMSDDGVDVWRVVV